MIEASSIYGGLGLTAILAAGWQQVRVVAAKLVSLIFVRVKVHHPLCGNVSSYCYRHFRRSPFGLITFDSAQWFVRTTKRYQRVGFEKPGREPMIFWRGWCPVLLSALPSNTQGGVSEGDSVTITTIRGLVDLEELVRVSIEKHNAEAGASVEGRYRVIRYSGMGGQHERMGNQLSSNQSPTAAVDQTYYSPHDVRLLGVQCEDIGPERTSGKALDTLSFPPAVAEIVEELRRWLSSEAWYRSRGIPWRRGWLLFGKPGTGKTSLVRAIAQDFDLPVCVLDLATMSNREMLANWREALNYSPCIALIEDIDAVFEGRANVTGENGGGLSFDCLLNCISGIESANGVFLVITTNRPEMLDDALGAPRPDANGTMISTRPGRVDRALELPAMDEQCRRVLARRILADCPARIEELVGQGLNDTGAQFQERCAQVALREHWREL